MQVPVEQSTKASRQNAPIWLESLVICGVMLVALAGIAVLLSPTAAVIALSLALAALLPFTFV